MAFLITWTCPPAAREAHLGTERNACSKSKGGWKGWVLMRGISGTCLMVTFLPGAGGLSMKDESSPRALLHHSGPSHPQITGHGAAQHSAVTQEAIKTLICLHARKRSLGCRRMGKTVGAVGSFTGGEVVFVSRICQSEGPSGLL